jgi:magnesium-transporting ATPase (P-type)
MTAFFVTLLDGGWTWDAATGPGTPLHHAYLQATTATFVAIVACQVGTAFAARTDRVSLVRVGLGTNRLLLVGIAFELVFTAALVYLPAMNDLLGTAPLPWSTLLLVAPFPVVVWGVDELDRWARRRLDQAGSAGRAGSA